MSTTKTVAEHTETPTALPTTEGGQQNRPRRTRRPGSPWVALAAVLVVGGAVSFAAYAIAAHPTSNGSTQGAPTVAAGGFAPGARTGSLYDSQVPAKARDTRTCAQVGYGTGTSLYYSQVPAKALAGGSCVTIAYGPVGSLYDSQVPSQAQAVVATCVAAQGDSVYNSQVPAKARGTLSCVVVGDEPGGSLYYSQVPKAFWMQ